MKKYPVYINLTWKSAVYDILYFYISTENMIASNNSDTARYTDRNISSVSLQNGCADIIIQNKNEFKIFFTLCITIKNILKHLYTKLILLKRL